MDSIDYYNRYAVDYYDNTINLDMMDIINKFIVLLPEGAAVLDLGCGSGRDSLSFIEEGFDVTAVDGSDSLCELAQIHIGQDVLNLKYEEIDFHEVFDGIWACASLLHVPENKIDDILEKVIDALKDNGVLYMSFQYGDFAGEREGRYFKEYNTHKMKELIGRHNRLTILDIFKTNNVRTEKIDEKWINILARKRET